MMDTKKSLILEPVTPSGKPWSPVHLRLEGWRRLTQCVWATLYLISDLVLYTQQAATSCFRSWRPTWSVNRLRSNLPAWRLHLIRSVRTPSACPNGARPPRRRGRYPSTASLPCSTRLYDSNQPTISLLPFDAAGGVGEGATSRAGPGVTSKSFQNVYRSSVQEHKICIFRSFAGWPGKTIFLSSRSPNVC